MDEFQISTKIAQLSRKMEAETSFILRIHDMFHRGFIRYICDEANEFNSIEKHCRTLLILLILLLRSISPVGNCKKIVLKLKSWNGNILFSFT